MRHINIRTKVLVFGLLFAIVPLVFTMTPFLLISRNVQTNDSIDRQNQVAQTTARQISQFISTQMRLLQRAELLSPELLNDSATADLLLERMLADNISIFSISLVNEAGQEVEKTHRLRASAEEELGDISQNKEFLAVKDQGAYIGPVFFQEGRQRPLFKIGTAIHDERGEMVGTIFAVLDARKMQEAINNTTVTQRGGRVYVVNEEGVVLAHPNISQVLARENFSQLPIVSEIKKGERNALNQSYKNERGNEVLGAWAPVEVQLSNRASPVTPEVQWYVVSEERASFVLRHVREGFFFSLISLGVVLLIVLVVIWVLSGRIVRPILKLNEAIKKFGRGNLYTRADVETKDEIGDLARNFNVMADFVQKARERDKTISQAKSEFISIAAHQLRTPLSTIKWTFQMLLEDEMGKLTKEQKKFLRRGNETNERMIQLINDLLSVSRIEEGKFGFEFKKASLVDVVENVVQEEKLRAEKNEISFEFNKPEKEFPQIVMDPEKITMVVANLVDNSIKYTPSEGKIEINITRSGKFLQFSISDTGVGVPNKQMSRLFSKFFRGENAMRMQTEGSGLGLFLVKNIVERHGGEVWAESEEGEGSTFYFTLPLKESMIPSEKQFHTLASKN